MRVRWIATLHGMESAWCEDWKRLLTSTRERRQLWRCGTGVTLSALKVQDLTLACPQLPGSPCWSGLDTHGFTGKTIFGGERAEVGGFGTLQVRMVIFPRGSSVSVTL